MGRASFNELFSLPQKSVETNARKWVIDRFSALILNQMKSRLTFSLILIATTISLVAAESNVFQLKDGTLIDGVERIEPQPNGIKIFHVHGMKYAKIHELTDAQVLQYGLDSVAAENFDKQENEKRIKNSNAQVARQEEKDRQIQMAKAKKALETFASEKGINARGKILQVLHDDNAILLFNGCYDENYIDVEYRVSNSLWNSTSDPRSKKETQPVQVSKTRTVPLENLVMVSDCETANLKEDEGIRCRIYEFGTYTYKTKEGKINVIPMYTMSAEKGFLSNSRPTGSR